MNEDNRTVTERVLDNVIDQGSTPYEDPYEALKRRNAEARGAEGGTIEFKVDGSGLRRDFEWRDPEPRSMGLHLLALVQTIKHTGGAVEIMGVRIEPCNGHGETDTMRRLREISEDCRKREEQLGHAHDALRKARQHIGELERERKP